MLKYYSSDIYITEIPDEISLGYYFTGCPIHCAGCHSSDLWDDKNLTHSKLLTPDIMDKDILSNANYITNILFFGGDWDQESLFILVKHISDNHPKYAISLYTGLELSEIDEKILSLLNYIKTGPYIQSKGGLKSKTTNQRLYRLDKGEIKEDLTHMFWV